MKHMIVTLAAGLSLSIVTAIALADAPPPTTAPAVTSMPMSARRPAPPSMRFID